MNPDRVSEALRTRIYLVLTLGRADSSDLCVLICGKGADRVWKEHPPLTGGIRMPQGRRITRKPIDPDESVDAASSGGGARWAPIERGHGTRLDHANLEIIQVARGLLTRIVDLLK
jgi:hypothetical protein